MICGWDGNHRGERAATLVNCVTLHFSSLHPGTGLKDAVPLGLVSCPHTHHCEFPPGEVVQFQSSSGTIAHSSTQGLIHPSLHMCVPGLQPISGSPGGVCVMTGLRSGPRADPVASTSGKTQPTLCTEDLPLLSGHLPIFTLSSRDVV